MTIELTPEEILRISEALAIYKSHVDSWGEDDKSQQYKALRMKIDGLVLQNDKDARII